MVAYAYFYVDAIPLFADSDVPWHLATGHLILSGGTLPAIDPWSFTASGQPWYIISWLWDVSLGVIDRLCGVKILFIFTVAFAALIIASLAHNINDRKEAGSDALIFTLVLACLTLVDNVTARPQLAGYLCIVLFHRHLHKNSNDFRVSGLLWLIPIMVLWVNTHGSFIVGFTLLGAYLLQALHRHQRAQCKRLALISILCALSSLINPYGMNIYIAVMHTLHSGITNYVMEWTPFTFGISIGISALLMVFILVSNFREPGIPLADKIISFFWLPFILFAIRNASIFMLVSAPYMALSIQRFLDRLKRFRTARVDPLHFLHRSGMPLKMAMAAVMLPIASAIMIDTLKGQSYRIDTDKDIAPAINYLIQHKIGKHLLNNYNWGGRLIYETGGTLPIFIDGRAGTAYSEETIDDYITFLYMKHGWKQVLEKYRIDAMIVSSNQWFAVAYDNGDYHNDWEKVYGDEVAEIYRKK